MNKKINNPRAFMIPVQFFCKLIILCLVNVGLYSVSFAQDIQKNTSVETQNTQTDTPKNTQALSSIDYAHNFYREKKITLENGKSETKREYVTQTIPGEELLAIATYTYKKTTPTQEVIFTLPIPKETIYVENSATDADYLWYSADNAKEWSKFADLRVVEKDGTKRIALGKDVTHLQWRIAKPFKYGDTGTLEYKVIIR